MIDHEKAVLGAVLLDERVFDKVIREVEPRDFQDPWIGRLLYGIRKMRVAGEPVDVLTVSAKLAEWGIQVWDAVALHQLVDEIPTAANADYYARLVKEDALRREITRIAAELRERVDGEPVSLVRDAISELEQVQARSVPQRAEVFSPKQLMDVPTSYNWVIEGLLEARERVMITATEGFGKSTLIRQLAFTAAAGTHPFRDYQHSTPRRVLVIDAENTELQWARKTRAFMSVLAEQETGHLLEENLRVAPVRRLDLVKPSDLAMVHDLCDRHRPEIVCIGPLYRLVPRAIMTDDEAAPLLAALDTLRDRGIALVIEAHAGKTTEASGARNLAPRGSSALLGWPEFGLGLRQVKGKPREAEVVRWRGDRDERMWPKRLIKQENGLPWRVEEGGA